MASVRTLALSSFITAATCSACALAGSGVTIPASASLGPVPSFSGTGLNASIWTQSNGSSIAGSRSVISGNPAAGAFNASVISYGTASITTPLSTWLGVDAPTLTGLPGTTNAAGLTFLFRGFIALQSGTVNFTVTSDDGFELLIGGVQVSSADTDRGFNPTSATAFVSSSGLYPIELLYWANNAGDSGLRFSSATPGGTDAVVPTSALYPIPAPGAMALLGLGGLLTSRRRR